MVSLKRRAGSIGNRGSQQLGERAIQRACVVRREVSGSLGEVAIKVSKFKNLPSVAWPRAVATKQSRT